MMLFAFGALVLGWYKKSSASWERKRSNFYVKWFLRLSVLALPLPFIANTLGWYLTEAGRQPWIVVGLQKTASACAHEWENAGAELHAADDATHAHLLAKLP